MGEQNWGVTELSVYHTKYNKNMIVKENKEMTQDYVVTLNDGQIVEVKNAAQVKQVYGFLEFRGVTTSNFDPSLIVAIRAELIFHYSPANVVDPVIIRPSFKVINKKK